MENRIKGVRWKTIVPWAAAGLLLIAGVICLIRMGPAGSGGWNWTSRIGELKEDSEYRVIHEEHVPPCRIGDGDWFVADGRIFVLFERYSYLCVYDPEGTFQYAIQTCYIQNGTERIAYKDGSLIIHTRSGGIYLFDGPEKQEYIPWDRNDADAMERNRAYYAYIEHEFDAKRLNKEAGYSLENNTIYHLTAQEENEPVLSFPLAG